MSYQSEEQGKASVLDWSDVTGLAGDRRDAWDTVVGLYRRWQTLPPSSSIPHRVIVTSSDVLGDGMRALREGKTFPLVEHLIALADEGRRVDVTSPHRLRVRNSMLPPPEMWSRARTSPLRVQYVDTGVGADKNIPAFHRLFQSVIACDRTALAVNGSLHMNEHGDFAARPPLWSRLDWPDILIIGGRYDAGRSRLLEEPIRQHVVRAIGRATVVLVAGYDATALFEMSAYRQRSQEHSVERGLGILPGVGYLGPDHDLGAVRTKAARYREALYMNRWNFEGPQIRSVDLTSIGAPMEFTFSWTPPLRAREKPEQDELASNVGGAPPVSSRPGQTLAELRPMPQRFARITRPATSTTRQRHAMLFGGGLDHMCFDSPEGRPLVSYITRFTAKPEPLIVLMAASMGDKYHLVNDFYQGFSYVSAHLADIAVTGVEFSASQLALLEHADGIVLLGGNTPSLTAILQAHGLDKRIRAAYKRGAVIFGSSAGAVAMLGSAPGGGADYEAKEILPGTTQGLDLIGRDGVVHIDQLVRLEAARRFVADGEMRSGSIALATGVGAHFVDEHLVRGFAVAGLLEPWPEEEDATRVLSLPTEGYDQSAFLLRRQGHKCVEDRIPLVPLDHESVWAPLPQLLEATPNVYGLRQSREIADNSLELPVSFARLV